MGVAANRSTPLLYIYWRAHAHTLRRWSVCYWHIHNPYIKFRCIDSGKTPANQHLDIDISSRTPNFHGYATLSEDPPNWSAPIKYLHYSTFALDTCPFFTPITVL
ncbi:uncharacterized protein LOC125849044 isoform X1 [Solanum stenotomum]|uniref:uncharacterized protein LOC125849044 isoform X1 n=1 Tax=Solanum stenotomum TaxID=172797 RepID=UPI0020D1F219|nr:uncharacterized protein LOC125849044 isoform X1 [Solanum stenotomum]